MCNLLFFSFGHYSVKSLSTLPQSRSPPSIFLDAVPHSHLDVYLCQLKAKMPRGAWLTLVFTTPGRSVTLFSTSFILAALPYFVRRHVRRRALFDYTLGKAYKGQYSGDFAASAHQIPLNPRSLCMTLAQVLQLLKSGSSPLTVDSVQNVSEAHATSLNTYVQNLDDDSLFRKTFVDQWGMNAWREEKFYMAWESAVLSAKLLERWSVIVHT